MIKADDILLYISDNASEDLRHKIQQWIQQDPKNKEEFDLLSNLWNHSDSLKQTKILDTESAWNSIEHLIHDESSKRPIPKTGNNAWIWGLLVLVFILVLYFFLVG